VLEKYLEYGLVLLKKFKDQGKTLDEMIEQHTFDKWASKGKIKEITADEVLAYAL
jgi:hypothetical protein